MYHNDFDHDRDAERAEYNHVADPYPRRREDIDIPTSAIDIAMFLLLAIGTVAFLIFLFFLPDVFKWMMRAMA